MKPKEIATNIIAEGRLQPGTDEVSKIYSMLMRIDKYIVRYLEKESEKKREKLKIGGNYEIQEKTNSR